MTKDLQHFFFVKRGQMADWRTDFPRNLGPMRRVNEDTSEATTDEYGNSTIAGVPVIGALVDMLANQQVAAGVSTPILWNRDRNGYGATLADQPLFTYNPVNGEFTLKAGEEGLFRFDVMTNFLCNAATTSVGKTLTVQGVVVDWGELPNDIAGQEIGWHHSHVQLLTAGATLFTNFSSVTDTTDVVGGGESVFMITRLRKT